MSVDRAVFVLLPGKKDMDDHYQLLQEEVALSTGQRLGLRVEVSYAPGFDQLRVLKKRLGQGDRLDAVITEPSSVSSMDNMLKELRGGAGLVLLNAWGDSVEDAARGWGPTVPFGTVSTDQTRIGRVQARQVNQLLPRGGAVLVVTGPQRSSAAQERLEALRSSVGPHVELLDTQAGEWTEAAGRTAFGDWYRVFKSRSLPVPVVAAQSDELAVGVRDAIRDLDDPRHREDLSRAKLLGMDGCPAYGRRLVDEGTLTATIENAANTGLAIDLLHRFWTKNGKLPLRSFTELRPYPASSIPAGNPAD
jgi:ABC-type sugar transport system substrate-binding protein